MGRLRDDAIDIWRAGLRAVDAQRLVREAVRLAGNLLTVQEESWNLADDARLAVVGAGKAAAGMAAGLEAALDKEGLEARVAAGWVNVPADCTRPLHMIHTHAARPAGVNEPTEEGVRGTRRILEIVGQLCPEDVCLVLLSGGASALLPAPCPGVSLASKVAVTRALSAAGASIHELNTVRKHLSQVKGGGLARACRAGRMIVLVISDVMGDPLEIIGSGPAIADSTSAEEATRILERLLPDRTTVPEEVWRALRDAENISPTPISTEVEHVILANNATAVDAAGLRAVELGYTPAMVSSTNDGRAEEVGRHMAAMLASMGNKGQPDALISGGEPTVELCRESERGRGGRNQQLALAALEKLAGRKVNEFVLLSAGTDGEDGPTDAAGAIVELDVLRRTAELELDPQEFLARNDAYSFFEKTGGLFQTGPTHTNVCDLRVVLARPPQATGGADEAR